MIDYKQLDFQTIVEQIIKDEVVLPDFQRGFTWRDYNRQKAIIASVLTKLPIGTVLLLEDPEQQYGCKKIGKKIKVVRKPENKAPYLLIDGQQRLTTLTAFFSDLIDDKDIVSPTLRRKYYIQIPSFDLINNDNIFGVFNLSAQKEIVEREYPDFMTNDIVERIGYVDSGKATDIDKKMLFGDIGDTNEEELADYCANLSLHNNNYIIPVCLLYGATKNKNVMHNERLCKIINRISEHYKEAILRELQTNEKITEYVKRYICKSFENKREIIDYMEGHSDEILDGNSALLEMIRNELKNRAPKWAKYVEAYLESCIENMELTKIELNDNQERLRAIDIYENMNKGGKALDVFDLLLAKAAKSNSSDDYNLRESIREYIKSNHMDEYDEIICFASDDVSNKYKSKNYVTYSASEELGCWDEKEDDLVSMYGKVLIDLLGIIHYFYDDNQQIEWKNKDKIRKFTGECIRRDYLLNKISSERIWEITMLACKAIDRAGFFLQIRCGVMKLSDVHYNFMLIIIAFVLLNDEYYENKDVNGWLEAWYWSAIFSGEFKVEQNKAFEKNIKEVLMLCIDTQKKPDYIINLANDIFKDEKFLTEDILLVENNRGIIAEDFIRDTVCQYYLSKTYNDILKVNYAKNNKIESINTFSEKKYKFQKHHIVPIGELQTKYSKIKEDFEKDNQQISSNERFNKWSRYNSPLNFVYITEDSNKIISNCSLENYVSYCDKPSLNRLGISDGIDKDDIKKDDSILREFLKKRFDALNNDLTDKLRTLLNDIQINS